MDDELSMFSFEQEREIEGMSPEEQQIAEEVCRLAGTYMKLIGEESGKEGWEFEAQCRASKQGEEHLVEISVVLRKAVAQ